MAGILGNPGFHAFAFRGFHADSPVELRTKNVKIVAKSWMDEIICLILCSIASGTFFF